MRVLYYLYTFTVENNLKFNFHILSEINISNKHTSLKFLILNNFFKKKNRNLKFKKKYTTLKYLFYFLFLICWFHNYVYLIICVVVKNRFFGYYISSKNYDPPIYRS